MPPKTKNIKKSNMSGLVWPSSNVRVLESNKLRYMRSMLYYIYHWHLIFPHPSRWVGIGSNKKHNSGPRGRHEQNRGTSSIAVWLPPRHTALGRAVSSTGDHSSRTCCGCMSSKAGRAPQSSHSHSTAVAAPSVAATGRVWEWCG